MIQKLKPNRSLFSLWRKEERIKKDRETSKISFKESSLKTIELYENYYENIYLPKGLIDFEDLYNDETAEKKVIYIIISFHRLHKSMLRVLVELNDYLVKIKEVNHTTYFVYKCVENEPTKAYFTDSIDGDSMDIYKFFRCIKGSVYEDFFMVQGGISIKKPFHLVSHGIDIILNDGKRFFRVKELIHETTYYPLPIFYPEYNLALRSKIEANIALLLTNNKIKWEYEKEGFILEDEELRKATGFDIYYPDFYVQNNVFIEGKGTWDIASLMKCSLFIEKYPDYKLIIIDSEDMYYMDKKVKNLEGWTRKSSKPAPNKVLFKRNLVNSAVKTISVGDSMKIIEKYNNIGISDIELVSYDGELIGLIDKKWEFIIQQKIERGMTFIGEISAFYEPDLIEVKVRNITDESILKYSIFNI